MAERNIDKFFTYLLAAQGFAKLFGFDDMVLELEKMKERVQKRRLGEE